MIDWPKTKRQARGIGWGEMAICALGRVEEGALVGTVEWAVSQPYAY